jgi:hypothetical protein
MIRKKYAERYELFLAKVFKEFTKSKEKGCENQ